MKIRVLIRKYDNLCIVYALLFAVLLIGTVSSPRFLTTVNLGNIAEQAVGLGIVSLGQALAILLAGIDLSVGAVVSLSTAIMSVELLPGAPGVLLNLGITVAAGTLVGAFNGFGIVRLRIPPFIMTLSTMCMVNGIALKIRPVPGGSIPYGFMDLLFGRVGIFPHALLLWSVLGAALIWLLHHRRFGRNLYAIGGNAATAALSGIPVGRVRVQAHVLCSVIAAVGGICVAARMGSGDATLGDLTGMDSVTVCVLGGISLFGGQGNIVGLLASTLILSGISNILNMIGVSSYYQYVFKGLVLLITVLVFSVKSRRKEGPQ
ncbi:ABC transporter permease [Butyricicoccus faecihominis]|uniref:ABC transporter permease n=1 Tax=Butyricicoccus faecihominis TaxID=1712515 RepID=UPI0024799DED|nr:ABC transporter permease [Butyricicoccus faecihominis]MCQ5130161.1 ABC transporter permease [Butyricicoccus faecihominis]